MRRLALVTMAIALVALPAGTAAADNESVQQNYSLLREQLKECNLDTNWSQLSDDQRAECNDLFRYYVLYTTPDNTQTLWIHCRSSDHCIETPEGTPGTTDPIPADAIVYDVQPRDAATKPKAKAAAHKRRHHHRH